MQSKQGRTLPFLGLSEGHINLISGSFLGATTFHCVADGTLTIGYNNADSARTVTEAFIAGDSFGIKNAKFLKIVTGTFHIGFD